MRYLMRHRGFTLVEMMITLTILAIVSVVAFPMFRKATLKSNRPNGTECLVEVQKRMEDYYTRNNQYPTLAQIGYPSNADLKANCPITSDGHTILYEVDLQTAPTATSPIYVLRASGIGAQAKDGTLLLAVDPRDPSTTGFTKAYDKQHMTPSGVTE